jgi:UDPglucose--hexose-1-phosphate uridylyltransferase
MTDVRRDPLTGHPVVVVAGRQHRPNLPPSADCPFCPGGLEAPDDYTVRWFVNRWPPMGEDRCEILLYTADHTASLWELGVERVIRVVELWTARTVALAARHDVASVLVFENRGPEVGATVPHPHGQVYAFERVPDAVAAEFTGPDCAVCAEDAGTRLVTSRGDWRMWVPAAAAWPYELRAAPAAHVPDLPAASGAAADLAAVLVDGLARLDQHFGAPTPYMLWVHQRPSDGREWAAAHLHVHVAPLLRAPATPRFVAAGELGSGVFFNPVDPEDAAAALRAQAGGP